MASNKLKQQTRVTGPAGNIQDFLRQKDVSVQFPQISASFPIQEIKTSSCKVACPAGVNIKGYLGLIARGEYEKALEIVRASNPLPGICGRVCTHPCESECRRGEFDEPLAICALKRFIADYALEHSKKGIEPCKRTKKEQVAIVGSGPAGLTAANDLIRLGYGVTVFEELPVAGGMLVVGIPPYRLPREIIQAEINDIAKLGVELKTNTRIEDFDQLLKEGYDAVFIAIGAHEGRKLNVPGEDDYKGIIDCITFLKDVNQGHRDKPGDKVIVIGGGNSAIDSARSAVRLGSSEVHIVYRRSREEMPGNEEEIRDAEAEGVKIDYLAAPVGIRGKDDRVIGMECTKMRLREPDESGRRRPIPIPGSEFVIDADLIISAISQKPDLSFLKEHHELKISKWDTFEVDAETLATSKPGIYAGGDAVTGPNTVIDAIAAGHRAARSIDVYLSDYSTKGGKGEGVGERELTVDRIIPKTRARLEAPKLPVEKRKADFNEVESAFTAEEAMHEAKRCLRCGPCEECIRCVKECDKKVLGLSTDEGRELLIIHGLPKSMQVNDEWHGVLSVENKTVAEIKVERVVSEVNEKLCRGCGECEGVCEYSVIKVEENEDGFRVAKVDKSVCKGCGICTSICPTGAIGLRFFGSKRIKAELEGFLA